MFKKLDPWTKILLIGVVSIVGSIGSAYVGTTLVGKVWEDEIASDL